MTDLADIENSTDAAPEAGLWRLWSIAAQRPEIDDALRRFYRMLDAHVASLSPRCDLSGRCCKFDTFGHRLYVTGLEIAWLLIQLDSDRTRPLLNAHHAAADGCPFQAGKLCSVHALRPLGCRVFFCDPAAQSWQSGAYEQCLADLRSLHDRDRIPYRYMEWRAGLDEALSSGISSQLV